MQPQYIPLATIFGPQVRYTVPLFQRPYVWSRAEQWEPLWDDIQALADRIHSSREGEAVAGHFLGTAVLEQATNPTGSLPRREIIDGQQRLTTLQLVLKAAQHALETLRATFDEDDRKPFDVAARQIGSLTENPAFSDDDEKYKVWPTNQDRESFRSVMDSGSAASAPTSGSRMAEAYAYFMGQIASWLDAPDSSARAKSLSTALRDHLRLIVLDLDDADEPQAIFETLNAHGTPLLPADLIKNWMIWEATSQHRGPATLYDRYWKHFDDDATYWRAMTGTGHAARARIDTFLQNWLTRRTRVAVPPKHLYDRFLRHVGARPQILGASRADVEALMEDVSADAGRFRRIDESLGPTRFDVFLRRLKTFDFVVFQPVLMALLGRAGSNQLDLDNIGEALESWLLRRMVCAAETRGYGTFALALLEVIAELDPAAPAAPAVISYLVGPRGLGFPTDAEFKTAFTTKPFYGYFRRDRVVMILRAIEERLMTATTHGEPIVAFNYDKLQVEHILPQSWETHWPLKEGADRLVRDSRVHAIGNLTLVSAKLNPALSNAPWLDFVVGQKTQPGKRSGLNEQSRLQMNARIVAGHPDVWDEQCIDKRAEELFEFALAIWPTPKNVDAADTGL